MLSVQAMRLRADSSWQLPSGGTGDWFNAANWSNGVPGTGDIAFIDNGGAAQISTGNPVAAGLDIGGASVTGGSLTVNSGVTLNIGADGVTVGNALASGSDASLEINDNANVIDGGSLTINPSGSVVVNQGSLTAASATISGGSLTFPNFQYNDGEVYTPISCPSITVQSGGVLNFDSQNASMAISGQTLVTGPGSKIEEAGGAAIESTDGATGGLQIEDGAQLSAQELVIGDRTGDSGSLTISGTGTLVSTEYEDFVSATRLAVNQTGGTNIATSVIWYGSAPGASSLYSMSGGVLQTPIFTLNIFTVPSVNGAIGTDNFDLSGTAAVNIGTEYIGLGGTANFTQSGGSNTVGALSLGSAAANFGYSYVYDLQSLGNYTLAAGTLQATSLNVGNGSGCTGTYTQTGGTAVFSNLNLAAADTSAAVCVLSGGSIQVTSNVEFASGADSSASLTLDGMSLTAPSLLMANGNNSRAVFTLSGGGALSAGWEVLGSYTINQSYQNVPGGTAAFIQTGGSNVAGTLILGLSNGAGTELLNATQTYRLSGGTLNVGEVDIGDGAKGAFCLSGSATLVAAGSETVGVGGTGVVTQCGGSNTAETLSLGSDAAGFSVSYAGAGDYTLSAGTLQAGTTNIANGDNSTGTFTQSGGTASFGNVSLAPGDASAAVCTFSGGGIQIGSLTMADGSNSFASVALEGPSLSLSSLAMGNAPGSTSVFTLSGSSVLTAGQEIVGNTAFALFNNPVSGGMGTFIQTGGTNVTGPLAIGAVNAAGIYRLCGGTLQATTVQIGAGGTGAFCLSGSTTLLVNGSEYIGGEQFEYGPFGGTGVFNQSGGSNVLENEQGWHVVYVGFYGPGTYNMSGGMLQASAVYVGSGGNSTGNFNLSCGTLTAPFVEIGNISFAAGSPGTAGTGIFTQTGGSVVAIDNFAVGSGPGTVGVYDLEAGALSTGEFDLGVAGSQPVTFTLRTGCSVSAQTEYVGGSQLGISNGEFLTQLGGTAAFSQIGGANSVTDLIVGTGCGSSAAYTLSGGSLAAQSVTVGGGGGAGSLTVESGGQLSVVKTLAIGAGGVANLDGGSVAIGNLLVCTGGQANINTGITINYGNSNDPISTIQSYLANGYAGGWAAGEIISSSVAAMNASQSALVYGIGSADGADGIIGGLSSGQIEIIPTLAGDAMLQGDVDFGDFQILAEYFGQSGGWDEGNFTYGPTIDFGDFQLLAQNFGANSSALTASEVSSLANFAAQFGDVLTPNRDGFGFDVVSVPEPVPAGVLSLAGFGMLLRRRRSHCAAGGAD